MQVFMKKFIFKLLHSRNISIKTRPEEHIFLFFFLFKFMTLKSFCKLFEYYLYKKSKINNIK